MGKEYGSINSSTFKCDLQCQNFELKFRCCAAQRGSLRAPSTFEENSVDAHKCLE